MQTIWINGRFLEQPVTGVQRYSREVLNALDEFLSSQALPGQTHRLVCLASQAARDIPNWKNIAFKVVGQRTGNLWEQIDLPLAIRGGVCFSPANVGPFFLSGQVVTIHDASVYAVPQAYSLAFRWKHQVLFRRLGKTARSIITVSEFSRQELARWCDIPLQKIQTIPEGCEHILRTGEDSSVFERLQVGSKPYFLCVGSNSPHKNFDLVLQALSQLEHTAFELIIVGGDFNKVFKGQVHSLPPTARRVGYLKDSELRALYRRSAGFIFPSLYEGFGLPPLEAMACGCPVLCSNAASLPEVGGKAALYFDPYDASGLAWQMQRLAADAALQADLRARGLLQAEQFTWEKTARATWKILTG